MAERMSSQERRARAAAAAASDPNKFKPYKPPSQIKSYTHRGSTKNSQSQNQLLPRQTEDTPDGDAGPDLANVMGNVEN